MNEEIENPPAFPVTIPGDEKAGWQPEHIEGMTLRDYFAAKHLQGVSGDHQVWKNMCMDNKSGNTNDYIAKECYSIADAMLKARLK